MEAKYWHLESDQTVQCRLCPHACRIAPGRTGRCGVRRAVDGRLVAEGYGMISSAHLDPVEKKPLYHFHPGSTIFSIGGWGCNLTCQCCQNWNISQRGVDQGNVVLPDHVASEARQCGAVGVAYTYNEPLIGYEYVFDCARAVRAAGLVNVLVTNGFVALDPLNELIPWVNAMNIDLKSMDDAYYRRFCGARLQPVLDCIVRSCEAGIHVELTTLVITGINDTDDHFRRLADWVAEHAGRRVPLHLSAYHPDYRMTEPRTPSETLERGYRICRERLSYVYLGNVRGPVGCDTVCPDCATPWVRRSGYTVQCEPFRERACPGCGRPVDLVI
ncbi:MAG: AmmeMemoRadiSam system radical SAM enzyme [Lentisphaerae bacterium RIFOXYC12_FULL_60_16]|nr:MAG: AmmeMemoRadiSam system radical SAM enzyme [Lentisphaerae bacterium RIFOXYC12_FULL_60_16]OGV86617.1 MAG: AmmeMemoRadiSam system radical SAM enzyme [Lentisphaerae bacterium RIFOXYB12_FULL_60_10]